MAVTNAIRAALLADLTSITIGNGYEITIAKVYAEPIELDKRVFPSAALYPEESGESVVEQLGNRTGIAKQTFSIELMVKSATPNEDIGKLLDSARNAVEWHQGPGQQSAIHALAYVHEVNASAWERIHLTSDNIREGYAVVILDVVVDYRFSRGFA